MELNTLKQISHKVAQTSNLDTATQCMLEQLGKVIDANLLQFYLNEHERCLYRCIADHRTDLAPPNTRPGSINYGEGLISFVADREEPVNLDSARAHPNYLASSNEESTDLHSFLGSPMISRGDLIGVVVLQRQEVRHFSEEEEAFLVTLCAQLANLIADIRDQERLSAQVNTKSRKRAPTILTGVMGCSGVALGKAVFVYPPADLEAIPDLPADDTGHEIRCLKKALSAAKQEIQALGKKAKKLLTAAENALFDAYVRILDSRALYQDIEQEIKSGLCAEAALKRVIRQQTAQFEALEDPYLQERSSDFRDLGRRILFHMQEHDPTETQYHKKTILVSDEVSATSLLEVPEGQLVGIVSGAGSASSHVAILASAMGVPAVMGVGNGSLRDLMGKDLIVDAYNAHVYVSPGTNLKREFKALAAEEQELDEELKQQVDEPAVTLDGHAISLLLNTGIASDGGLSLSVGAEGVGLYRTEMSFMLRSRFPSEEEQRVLYRQLLSTFHPRAVVMRTLDIGGDKELPYFSTDEEQSFLGWRGVRITLDHPDIFLQQVRAMLQASEGLDNLKIMLPMISTIDEVDTSYALIQQAYQELIEEGFPIKMPQIGCMIEVPAAVYQSHPLAKRLDFLSVGSNDLIQYLLAVDRNNSRVAHLYSGFHPAVLHAMKDVVKSAQKANRPVSLCGEFAGDPAAVLLLVGLGFDALSMNARNIPRAKRVIRHFSLDAAQTLAKEALKLTTADAVRQFAENALIDGGLGGLIRAGK